MTYALIDSGGGEKLEQFGPYRLIRPCSQAIWKPLFPEKWKEAEAHFSRKPNSVWKKKKDLPLSWEIEMGPVLMHIEPTSFGHVGLFPEHFFLEKCIIKKDDQVLNLFAYTGLGSLLFAKKGAKVCHVDAAKPSITWAKNNAANNGIETIRWIVDDAMSFVKREKRRKAQYHLIVMDPPTFGRGPKGELFKIEQDLWTLLAIAKDLLLPKGKLIVTLHTPGMTPLTMEQLLSQTCIEGSIAAEELILRPKKGWMIPSGVLGIWTKP
jgi:23S rRNA (cytosine1962-C5)-methyltransferase